MPAIMGPTGALISLFFAACFEMTRVFSGIEFCDPRFQQLFHEIDRDRVFNSSSYSDVDDLVSAACAAPDVTYRV